MSKVKVIVYKIVEKLELEIDNPFNDPIDDALRIAHSDYKNQLNWQPVSKPYLAVRESEYVCPPTETNESSDKK